MTTLSSSGILATGQLVHTFAGHEDAVNAVSVSPDGRHALSGSHDRTLRLWELRNRRAPSALSQAMNME